MYVDNNVSSGGNLINWSELVACRLCCETSVKLKYYFLRNNNELLTKISNIIQIEINLEDPIENLCPNLICEGCFDRIGEFNQFKIRCQHFHSKWRSKIEANSQFTENEAKCNDEERLTVDHRWEKTSDPQEKYMDSDNVDGWIKVEEVAIQEESTEPENLTFPENYKIEEDSENASFRVDRYGTSYWTTAYNYMSRIDDSGFQCKLCPAVFKWSYQCEVHIRGHTNETPFMCEYCDKGFTAKHYLSSHIKEVHRPSAYMCKICGRQFSRNYLLNEHEMEHCGSPKLKCPQCNVKFYGRTKLSIHIRHFHSNRHFTCDLCGKEYKTKLRLSEHLIRHIGYRSHRCSHCDTAFVTKRDLNAHLKRESHLKNLRSFE